MTFYSRFVLCSRFSRRPCPNCVYSSSIPLLVCCVYFQVSPYLCSSLTSNLVPRVRGFSSCPYPTCFIVLDVITSVVTPTPSLVGFHLPWLIPTLSLSWTYYFFLFFLFFLAGILSHMFYIIDRVFCVIIDSNGVSFGGDLLLLGIPFPFYLCSFLWSWCCCESFINLSILYLREDNYCFIISICILVVATIRGKITISEISMTVIACLVILQSTMILS